MNHQTKKVVCVLLAIISILTVVSSVSYAYFSAMADVAVQEATLSTGTMKVRFADGNAGMTKVLKFDETVTKTFTIENEGTLKATVRMYWDELINTYTRGSLTYTLSYSTTEDGIYTPFVTNKKVPKSKISSRKSLATNIEIPAKTTYYYKLIITLNYLDNVNQDADFDAKFSTKFALENEMCPKSVLYNTTTLTNGLKVYDESATTYNECNAGEMYTFRHDNLTTTTSTSGTTTYTHSATQIMDWSSEERKDYRYIGSNPNNYIEFNGETWRIIGVFTVEREVEGNESTVKEQLIKIVRNESIGIIPWDDWTDGSRTNEWSTASLQTLLNGAYLNTEGSFNYTYKKSNSTEERTSITIPKGLNDTARGQIAKVKWYLGGSGTDENLGGPDYYNFERGTITCVTTGRCSRETRSTSILENVGLIYPSDYIFTYAKGVDTTCYTNGRNCRTSNGGTPEKGWMKNMLRSNNNWLLSPSAGTSYTAFYARSFGEMYGSNILNDSYSISPVVYLKSGIKIIDGDGNEDFPYQLGE